MKKMISCILSIAMLSSVIPVKAADFAVGTFTHQNVVGSQTCYANDTAEKAITEIPDVIQGMRINQPVFRAYMESGDVTYTVNQMLKDGTVLNSEEIKTNADGVLEFRHVRNCEMIEILSGETVVMSLDTEKEYVNGVAITSAPMSYQIYQRDEFDTAEITIKGSVSDATSVSVEIAGSSEDVEIENGEFIYTTALGTGLYDITVSSDLGNVVVYEQVGVGDVWVAAGQSNMTDMGAITDGFAPDTQDPVNDNMHIIYAEDCKWQKMSHPAGEGRFFKSGTRTSPVTSFAREISEYAGVPVGIVQSSVGGTNVYQWIKGVRDSDANSGYLFNALKACFDKMPSTRVKGILWYQGCNDAINENYVYNYKNLQQKVFDEMRAFFGEDTPIITTQLNDANQDSNSSQGYYDAWSFVKDVQRQNESLYENVYVVGTGELELGDTIHNSAISNVKLGNKWANAAKNVVYGDTKVEFRQPTIDKAKVTGTNEITLTFKNTEGLTKATGTKRIGITNVSGGGYKIALGDLTKEFVVRKGGNKVMTASNTGKGTTLTVTNAEIVDNTKVVLTTEEELSGVVAVDCMYGKRFTPTLVDAITNESVLSFYNVIAEYEGAMEITPAVEVVATDTADLNDVTDVASDSSMYVNKYTNGNSYALIKFDLPDVDLSKIVSATLAVYTTNIEKDRSGNVTVSEITTDWDNTATYANPDYAAITKGEIRKISTNTAGIFPVGNYSAIDITDYIKSYTGTTIGIGLASDYPSVATLAGVNSENPPKLIIQPGKAVELTYTADGEACKNVEVTIEGIGATEYVSTTFVTDENGKINVNLTEGEYRATTETVIGGYMESSNKFTVTEDVSESYTLVANTATPIPTAVPTPVPDELVYTFGNEYILIKDFNTSALSETAIGDTGFKVSTSTSNYNNVVVRDKASTNTGYYPYGSGLSENGYYLFIGAGGNSSMGATLVLPNTVEAGKYIRITYAKPKATNNGTTERTSGNTANTIKVGTDTIDLQNDCKFDEWNTTTMQASADVSQIEFSLGKWSAVAVAKIEVLNDAVITTPEPTPTPTPEVTPDPNVTPTPVPDEIIYTFGNAYNQVKEFNTSALSETAIGNTGFKVLTDTSNWNNVVVRNKTSENNGYYPYGDGLADRGYYLFLGSGGNSSVSAKLTLPNEVEAGKYIKITYAKPKATNNGSAERSSANSENTITVNGEVIDLQNNCEFDAWYTTTIKATANVSAMDIALGKWSAVAIASVEVCDSADTMEFTSDVTEKYITPDNQTVQYKADIYNSITTLADSDTIISKGSVDESAKVEYSVNGYNGISIDENGVLTITNAAAPGEAKVSAKYGKLEKSVALTLKALGNADAVEIFGDEVIRKGESKKYIAMPLAQGTILPERDTKWEIVGEAYGSVIRADGTLTAGDAGNITLKATLAVAGVQTSEVSQEFVVTVRDENAASSPYTINGILLANGETDITKASGIDSLIIEKTAEADGKYTAIVKVFDAKNKLIAQKSAALSGLADGVQSVDIDMELKDAAFIKAYIVQSDEKSVAIVSCDKDIDAVMIKAEYDGERLIKASSEEVHLSSGKNVFDVDSDAKLMFWDSLTGMKPVAQAATETDSTENVVSDEVVIIRNGEYTNVPLVADWITGAKSGLGMGAGIISPDGVPYGIDPELVDVATLNVSYTYDDNYPTPTTDNALWYKTGAYLASSNGANNSIYARDGADWEQKALPIGNGYMGGMLFGLPDKDQIQINEETFWAAGYRGTQTEVNSNTVNKNMSEGINGYMSVGNIFVDFNMPKGAKVNNYYRDLNLDESVAHVQYEYDGVKYNREYFASYPKEVLVFRYSADELNFDVKPVSMHPGKVTVNDGEITIIGKLKDSEPYSSGGNAAWNQESDLEYCTKIKVIADDGTVTDGYNTVNVAGSTGVTIIVAAATDYDADQFVLNADGSVDMTKTPYKSKRGVAAAIDKATARVNSAAAMSYDELKAEHIADYKSQFDTVKFSLTDENEICQLPTDELQASYSKVVGTTAVDGVTKVSYDSSAYASLNKHLEELHYNYSRYMMISSSRSDTMPANLQGKWCQSVAEIWGSCYCININMEMNYWFAGGANLLDSGKALVKWFNSQIPAGRVTAKNMYKVTPKSYTFADGKMTFTDSVADKDDVFIMHTKQAIMGTTDMTGSTNIQSPGNTAWLMYNLWDLYLTSGDKELLKNELYPIMRKAANFYTQYLYTNMRKTTTDTAKYPDGYYYTTWAGRSPEQGPTHEGIKYDLQLVAGMYDYTIAAAEALGVDADKVSAWKEIRNHLEIPVELGDDGQIKEWAEETTYNTDASGNALGDPVHRHISHLVGLYPGTLINRDTPELLEGAKIVLKNRGDDSTGWSCSNKFLLWARALEGDKALELFRFQLAKKTYSNLFDTHAPFQIDGNFGSAAGVMELLMQSHTGDIYILPALPAAWESGEISGIRAKNGATVSIKWENGKATEIKIIPAVDGNITIGYEKGNTLALNGADVVFTNSEYTIENAKAGEEYVFVSK